MKENHKKVIKKRVFSNYLKILINYFQMISIIQSFNIKWPFATKQFLESSSSVPTIYSRVFSIDCLISDYEISIEPIYLKTLIANILPFMIIFNLMIFFKILHLMKKNNNFNRFFSSVMIMIIFLQPNILQQIFDNLNCTIIGNKSFLTKQLNIDCDSNDHLKWVS